MEILLQVLEFAAKGFIIFVVVAACAIVVFSSARRRRSTRTGQLEVRALNRRFEALSDALRAGIMGRKEFRALVKGRGKPKQDAKRPKLYLLEFDGDLLATAVEHLREEVTSICGVATPDDEIVVRIESGGGAVPHYGLAAAQLSRLRERKLKVTACIDRVAASGGYMMACVADKIVAAPFSIIGSIGVVAQVPNLHRFLKHHDVDFEEATAGEFKRTVSLLGEITPKGRAKLQEQLEETHALFKGFVKQQRPSLDIDKVSTGEYWLGMRAKELNLVDALSTSDDYLLSRSTDADIYKVTFKPDRPWRERLGRVAAEMADGVVLRLLTRLRLLELR